MKDLDILKVGARAVAYEFSNKIQPIYDLLDYKWVFENEEYDVPNNEQIYTMLMNLINKLDDENDIISCGNLVVEKEYDEDSLVGLNLKMEITTEVYLDELKGEI